MKIFGSYNTSIIMQCQFYSGTLPLKFVLHSLKLNFLSNLQVNLDPRFFRIFKVAINSDIEKIHAMYNLCINDTPIAVKSKMWMIFESELNLIS